MAIPKTTTGEAADETALLAVIDALATSAGLTVTVVGTKHIYQGTGEDGLRNICFAIDEVGTRQFQMETGVDVDRWSIIGGSVDLFTNNDIVGAATPAHATTTTNWDARDLVSTYRYSITASKDGLSGLIRFISGGQPAQGILLGQPAYSHADRLLAQAGAKIASVGAGSSGSQRLITLDRDITAALTEGQTIFFQPVADATMPASDFAQVERAEILAGTLATPGGVTAFEVTVDKTLGTSKLFLSSANGGRYASNRGAGDIVRLCAEPTIVMCAADDSGIGTTFNGANNTALASWDRFGGQNADLDVYVGHQSETFENDAAPMAMNGQHGFWPAYVTMNDTEDGVLSGATTAGLGTVGVLPHLAFIADNAIPDFALAEIDWDSNRRYCVMEVSGSNGLGLPTGCPTGDAAWAHGPGF